MTARGRLVEETWRLFDAEVAAGLRVEEELDDVVEDLHRRLCEQDEVGAQPVDRDGLRRWFRRRRVSQRRVRVALGVCDLTQPVSEGAAQLQQLVGAIALEDHGDSVSCEVGVDVAPSTVSLTTTVRPPSGVGSSNSVSPAPGAAGGVA